VPVLPENSMQGIGAITENHSMIGVMLAIIHLLGTFVASLL
jgi:hypothetical protein